MTSTELVGPLPTVRFRGGPYRRGTRWNELPRVVYAVPANTLDPRYSTCTDHHVACDCREAEHAEDMAEHRAEWEALRRAARSALAGHQIDKPLTGYADVCLCSGCVIERATGSLLRAADVDPHTGRIKHPAFGWAPEEVPF